MNDPRATRPRRTVLTRGLLGGLALAMALFGAVDCGGRTGLDVNEVLGLAKLDGAASDSETEASLDASVPCIPGDIPLSKAEPAVMFVLDRSGSMRSSIASNNGLRSRWSVLTTALGATLPAVDQTMNIGALLYPARGAADGQCTLPSSVDVSPGKGHVDAVLNTMRNAAPSGPTPTADAIDVAASGMLSFRAAKSARALVLATDGAPDCNGSLNASTCRCATSGRCSAGDRCLDDARTVSRIASHAADGLPTYVIGIGDTGFDDVLDAMAIAGGRPRPGARAFYSAASESELTTALASIRDQIASCTFLTTSVPSGQGTIVLSLNGMTLPFDDSGATGWRWSDKTNGEITLAADACAAAERAGNAGIVAKVTCDADADADADASSSDADARATDANTAADAADTGADGAGPPDAAR